jgi:ribosomal protein S18 acetylase RimI-like enzyme
VSTSPDDDALRFERDPSPADVEWLDDQVLAATVEATGRADVEQLAAFVRDADGSLVAGISGWTWGGTCELQSLYVVPAQRGRGWGRRLLAAAADEARSRGCTQVVLFTHEVHAPGLYDRLGYELVGHVDDYPAGGVARWYRKRLA